MKDIDELLSILPEHWEMLSVETHFSDDGRDYNKPMFARKDGLARIYFNEGEEGTEYCFAIAYDDNGDGDCCGDFQEALIRCEEYIKEHTVEA